MAVPNWSRFDILHICIMGKLGGNCVHPFVKNSMNFMNLKAIPLRAVTLPQLPEEAGQVTSPCTQLYSLQEVLAACWVNITICNILNVVIDAYTNP